MDEHVWVKRVAARYASHDARVELGIGDDAAVLAPGVDGRVLSVDVAVEGVHFDRRWLSPEEVGWRAYVAALSDLAAMGASPVAGLSSLVLPRDVDEPWLAGLIEGTAQAADAYGAPVVGGNLSDGPTVMISTTVIGRATSPVTRAGARPGDAVYVTGPTGEAALGWRALRGGGPEGDVERAAVERWRRPRARFDVRLDGASAAVDVSDGLAQDLGHIAAASGVRIRIDEARLPRAPGFDTAARARGEDPLALILAGGEDYELAFTAPMSRVDAIQIGEVLEGEGVVVASPDGERAPPSGHRHLSE